MVCWEPGLLVHLKKEDFLERPLPLAQLMLSLSMDTVTEGNRWNIYTYLYIHIPFYTNAPSFFRTVAFSRKKIFLIRIFPLCIRTLRVKWMRKIEKGKKKKKKKGGTNNIHPEMEQLLKTFFCSDATLNKRRKDEEKGRSHRKELAS